MFWSLALPEWLALREVWQDQEQLQDKRLGALLAWIGNRTGGNDGKAFRISDFVGGTQDDRRQSVEEMKAILVSAFNVRPV